ncbi:MAG: LacI family DNA-binding transcriptional regulator [Aristaeellaceae bacterium]
MAEKQPTIYDVAEAAGVSIATVSRVMSGGSASARAKEKVEAAIARLNYRPSQPARSPDREKTRTLALVVTDLKNPYYTALCAGAEAEAARLGYGLQVYCTAASGKDLLSRLLKHRLDGAILVGGFIEDSEHAPASPSPEASREAIRQNVLRLQQAMPLVTIGPPIEGVSCVNISSDLGLSVRKSITHLTVLGHRRIAFIGGSTSMLSATLRETAFHEEMARRGLPSFQDTRTETGFDPQAGELCVTKLFSRVSPAQRPTALIAINDLVALGAMHQLLRMGLRVPEDVALIGCDNQFFTPFLDPPLTTVDLHPYDHGVCAVSELAAICSGSNPLAFSQIRECSLIVRESCGAHYGARVFD